MTITDVSIKTPDRKWDRGREWRHARNRRAEDFGIWKKADSWDLNSERVSWDLGLNEASRFSELAAARPVVCSGGTARGGVRWKSQHRKKLCLSLLMSKNLKLKKVNKSFVPKPISCFSDSYMRMNIMNVLCMWISWSYFWTWICYKKAIKIKKCNDILVKSNNNNDWRCFIIHQLLAMGSCSVIGDIQICQSISVVNWCLKTKISQLKWLSVKYFHLKCSPSLSTVTHIFEKQWWFLIETFVRGHSPIEIPWLFVKNITRKRFMFKEI